MSFPERINSNNNKSKFERLSEIKQTFSQCCFFCGGLFYMISLQKKLVSDGSDMV